MPGALHGHIVLVSGAAGGLGAAAAVACAEAGATVVLLGRKLAPLNRVYDAVKAVGVPTIEVHISDPDLREDFRKISYIRAACIASRAPSDQPQSVACAGSEAASARAASAKDCPASGVSP